MIKPVFLFLAALATFMPLNQSYSAEDLLSSEEAFKFDATLSEQGVIEAVWEIAPGYYVYKDKLSFEFDNSKIKARSTEFPEGKIKQDALFGEVEVFTDTFAVDIALDIPSDVQAFNLIAKGQGCNEPVGICYPPMSREVAFTLAQTAPASSALLVPTSDPASNTDSSTILSVSSESEPVSSSSVSGLDSASELRALLSSGFNQQEFLDVEQAFALEIEPKGQNTAVAHFRVTDGYYIYRDKVSFGVSKGEVVADLPEGKIKQDEYFGEVEIYDFDFNIPLSFSSHSADTTLIVNYQGCATEGICYSPVSKSFSGDQLFIKSESQDESLFTESPTTNKNESDNTPSINTGIAESEDNSTNRNDADRSDEAETVQAAIQEIPDDISDQDDAAKTLFGLLFGAFIAGILLTFTPCVLPLIPILSSVIAGQGNKLTRTRGGLLALAYVLGTVVTYAGMGALAGATGDQLQAYFQNIWAIGILSTLFFIMSLSMFGLFDLQMPGFIQERIQTKTGKLSGSMPLVFVLGLFSALIVGACVSPVLISFLGVAMTSQSPVLGAQLMVAMAWGMGLPLIAIGIGAGHIMPRAGQWMEKIKQAFGVMLIIVAIYLLGQLPQIEILLVWGGFFIILSIFLGATQSQSAEFNNWQKFEKGVGTILLVWGVLLLIGGMLGQRDIMRPIPVNFLQQGLNGSFQTQTQKSHRFTYVKTIEQLDTQLLNARNNNQPVMIDYYADWCVDCVRMEKTTFADPAVTAVLRQKFVTLKIDVTDPNDEHGKALKKRFSVFGPPATLFIDTQGQLLKDKNFYGYMESGPFLSLIQSL